MTEVCFQPKESNSSYTSDEHQKTGWRRSFVFLSQTKRKMYEMNPFSREDFPQCTAPERWSCNVKNPSWPFFFLFIWLGGHFWGSKMAESSWGPVKRIGGVSRRRGVFKNHESVKRFKLLYTFCFLRCLVCFCRIHRETTPPKQLFTVWDGTFVFYCQTC